MVLEPRLWASCGVTQDDRIIVMDLVNRLSKAQWVELYFHLAQQYHGQSTSVPEIVDDINERREIIEQYCKAMGPLGKH